MSVDKLVDSTQLDADLTSVANAIRTKGGTSASLAFPTGFVSAIQAISGGGGLPDYGAQDAKTVGGLLHALSIGDYHTGAFTVSSYFPANTESEILDTGYPDRVNLICIYDTAVNPYTASTEKLFMTFGFFNRPESSGADQPENGAYGTLRRRGGTDSALFGSRMTSYRVNSGKLYATPKYAQTNYTYFAKNSTYRWFAVPWPEVTS